MYYWHFAIFGLLFIIYVLAKVKNNKLSEGKSILWIIGGLLILLISLLPEIIVHLSLLLGIDYPPSLLFLLGLLFLVFMTFQQDHELSLLAQNMKILAQHISILEEALTESQRATVKERRNSTADVD